MCNSMFMHKHIDGSLLITSIKEPTRVMDGIIKGNCFLRMKIRLDKFQVFSSINRHN